MIGSNPHQWVESLRQRAAQVDVLAVADADDADRNRRETDKRRARLANLPCDPDAIADAAASPGVCPHVTGHVGSYAVAQAIETLVSANSSRTLLLLGPTGRGKSYAATWAIAETGGAWLCASDCRVAGWDDLRPRSLTSKLLVIDDLGRESSDWAARELADVLERRHDHGLRTIVTSNLTLARLQDRYGERCASRWSDPRTVIVDVLGADLRRRGQS